MTTKKSILHSIPTDLNRRDVFLIEGIRYAKGIIDISHKNLLTELYKFSINDNVNSESYYIIFKEAWSIIDFSWKLRNILIQLGKKSLTDDFITNSSNKKLNLNFLTPLRDFRNTFQHLDERIDEVIVDENTHVWGNLSWLFVKSFNNVDSCSISPGHPRSSVPFINPSGLFIKSPLCHITLDSINRNKERIKINLSELVNNINDLITQFENILKPQFEALENKDTHAQDLIVKISISFDNN